MNQPGEGREGIPAALVLTCDSRLPQLCLASLGCSVTYHQLSQTKLHLTKPVNELKANKFSKFADSIIINLIFIVISTYSLI